MYTSNKLTESDSNFCNAILFSASSISATS